MNIALISTGYPPEDAGGIGTYTANLARGLSEAGHKVVVLSKSTEGDSRQTINGVEVYRYGPRYIPKLERFVPGLAWSRFIAERIKELDRIYRFDVIEFPNWEGVGFWYLLHKNRKPVITRLHTAQFETFPIDKDKQKMELGDHFICWIEKNAVCQSDSITSSTLYHKNFIAKAYGIDPANIFNIPLGIPIHPTEYPEEGPPIFEKEVNILTVGRLEKRKGTLQLLQCIPRILEKFPNTKFTFVGNDRPHAPNGKTFEEYFKSSHPTLSKNVHFVGFVPYHDIGSYYKKASLFVLPSICENFGLVYVEAMAHGIPCIALRATSVPEVVKDGQTGLLVSPDSPEQLTEAICYLLDHNDQRERMGQNARKHCQKYFSYQRMAESTERLYSSVIDKATRHKST